MELQQLEVTDLVEVPSPELEEAYGEVRDAIEGETSELAGALIELGRALIEGGLEVLSEFLGAALEALEDAGVLEAVKDVLTAHAELAGALVAGVEALAELPPEDQLRLLALVAIALEDPTRLEDEELLRLLLRGAEVGR